MPFAARPGDPITSLFVAIALFASAAGCHDRSSPPPPPPPPPKQPNPESIDDQLLGKPPGPSAPALGARCRLGGPSISVGCHTKSNSLAVAHDGTVFLATDTTVRHYKRAPGPACVLEPEGAGLALPSVPASRQPAWHLVATDAAVYAYEFLGGVYRVDRGTAEPICTDLEQLISIAALAPDLIAVRHGIEQLALGANGHQDQPRPALRPSHLRTGPVSLYAIHHQLYGGSPFGEVTHFTPERRVVADTKLCSVASETTCGNDTCVFDSSCMSMLQLDRSDKIVRRTEGVALFGEHLSSITAAGTTPSGAVLVLGLRSDGSNEPATCNVTVFELPPSAFGS